MIAFFALLFASYLVGAIPFALLLARCKGVDIRSVGSGNVGATNVFRSVSKRLGVLTFIADAAKGWGPALFFPLWASGGLEPAQAGLCYGCAAIAGHNWPVFLNFKGGKGVATSAGVLWGVAPLEVAIGLGAWGVVFGVSRYVSLASIAAALAIPAVAWWRHAPDTLWLPAALTVLGLLVVVRHRSNIVRLLKGTEHQFKSGKKTMPAAEAAREKESAL